MAADVVYWPRHLRRCEAPPLCVRLSTDAVCVVGSGPEVPAGLEPLPAASARRCVVLFEADVAALGGSSQLHAPSLVERMGREVANWGSKHTRMQEQQRTAEPPDGTLRRAVETVGYYSLLVPSVLLLQAADAFRYVVEEMRTPTWLVVGGGKSAAELSAFLAVLAHQAHNAASWPRRARHFYLRSKHGRLSHQERMEMIEACNWICVSLLDVVLGRLAFFYFVEIAAPVLKSITISPNAVVEFLRGNVEWLMGAPAGFKLNKPLASILGNGILLWLDLWRFLFTYALPQSNFAGLGQWMLVVYNHMGLMLQLTLLSDALNLATWHSHWVYLYFAKLNRLQFALFSSLWKLFVGKKINVLRHRVDSCEYDVGQLLLGTLLFTILAFLVTTNLVFFVFFAAVRGAIVFLSVVLWLPVVLLRSLPLASLVYRLWHPYFFVVGMQLRSCESTVAECTEIASLENVEVGCRTQCPDVQERRLVQRALHLWGSDGSLGCKDTIFELMPVVCNGMAHFARLRVYLQAVAARYSISTIMQTWLFGMADIAPIPLDILFGLPGLPSNTS